MDFHFAPFHFTSGCKTSKQVGGTLRKNLANPHFSLRNIQEASNPGKTSHLKEVQTQFPADRILVLPGCLVFFIAIYPEWCPHFFKQVLDKTKKHLVVLENSGHFLKDCAESPVSLV